MQDAGSASAAALFEAGWKRRTSTVGSQVDTSTMARRTGGGDGGEAGIMPASARASAPQDDQLGQEEVHAAQVRVRVRVQIPPG